MIIVVLPRGGAGRFYNVHGRQVRVGYLSIPDSFLRGGADLFKEAEQGRGQGGEALRRIKRAGALRRWTAAGSTARCLALEDEGDRAALHAVGAGDLRDSASLARGRGARHRG